MKLHGLYAITPDRVDSARIARAIEGGIAALQYRNKRATREQRLREAKSLAALCRKANVLFIVNDDVEIAIACGADGAHLGRDDGDIAMARSKLKGRLLGVSCYNSLEAARAAVAAGADYVAFGSVFPSPTKPGAVRAPLALFAEARALGVPLVAIGGVTLENAPQPLAAGADCVAVISDLFDAPDVAGRAQAYGRLFAHEIAQ
ncbi:MAG: thiamine phosphate synthase [Betaproteobacteria bacterium]|nr:thiamine phosphate synthase [Betaproteobacteria bacterium]